LTEALAPGILDSMILRKSGRYEDVPAHLIKEKAMGSDNERQYGGPRPSWALGWSLSRVLRGFSRLSRAARDSAPSVRSIIMRRIYKTMKKIIIIAVLAVLIPTASWSSTLEEFGKSVSYFYTAPTQNSFEQFQKDADTYRNELNSQGNGADVLVSVMIAKISQKYNWPIVSLAFGDKAKEIAVGKSDLAKYVSDDALVDPGKFDIWWAIFFATGDNAYLEKIFRYAGEDIEKIKGTKDILVYGSANWSFKANCQQHEKVRLFAEEKQKKGSYSEYKMKYLQECISHKNIK